MKRFDSERNLSKTVGAVLLVLTSLIGVILYEYNHPQPGEVWSGYFGYLEFEVRFLDSNGRPIEGVTLKMERHSGAIRYHDPIVDFYPGRVPTSDANGVMQFHCCGSSYGGMIQTYFFGLIQSGDSNPPDYTCRFQLDGKDIYVCSFNDVAWPQNFDELPRVKRTLALPDEWFVKSIPPPSELPSKEYEFVLVKKTIRVE